MSIARSKPTAKQEPSLLLEQDPLSACLLRPLQVSLPLLLSLLMGCSPDEQGQPGSTGQAPAAPSLASDQERAALSQSGGGTSAARVAESSTVQARLPAIGRLEAPVPIVLITVDTLRRDHLGCYGYARETSPNIDALAAEGIVFERALASMATTVPSHLSMMTGQYPFQHGVTSNAGALDSPFRSKAGVISLARALGDAGYATAAVVSSLVVVGRTGLGDGFAFYAAPSRDEKNLNARETTDRALAWLDSYSAERPLFLWVHYWDTHEPNQPEPEFLSLFERQAPSAEWLSARDIQPDLLFEKHGANARHWEMFFLENELPTSARREGMDKSKLVASLVNRYDADLRFIDTHLGRLLERLREMKLLQNSLTIFTADHGQALGEGNRLGHGVITNVNTFVPLIVRLPKQMKSTLPARAEALVSLIDLAPTILARLGNPELGKHQELMTGMDLFSGGFERGFALTQQASAFHTDQPKNLSRSQRRKQAREALLTEGTYGVLAGRWKFLFRHQGKHELYDLEAAGEGVDVLSANQEIGNELRAIVEQFMEGGTPAQDIEVPGDEEHEELLENLRSLGYMDALDDE